MTYPTLKLYLNGLGVVVAQRALAKNVLLVFRAENVREAASGVHARLEILLDSVMLGWTTCNVERDEDRLRLTNRVSKLITPEQRGDYSPDFFKHDLDRFCLNLWPTVLSQVVPENLGGEANWKPQMLVDPFVIKGGGTIMFAPPKTMKSYTALLIAQSVNSGCSKLWPTLVENTLFVNLERSRESVRGRLARVNSALDLPADQPLHILHARGRSLKSMAPALQSYIAEHQIGFGLLDSISRTGMGGLISPEEVNPVIDTLNNLFPTWLALAHTPRGSGEHIWGGQMWDAGADVLVMLKTQVSESNPTHIGVSYTISSANDLLVPPSQVWEFNFEEGLTVTSVSTRDYPELAPAGKMSLTQEIMDYLLEAQKATASQIATELTANRGNISHLLKNSPHFVRVGPVGPKGQVYYGVKVPRNMTPETFR